jgi:hypothetical protein
MKKYLYTLLIIATYCSSFAQKKVEEQQALNPDLVISHVLISAANGTWGYDIYSSLKLTIHQPTIPGKPGNEGFKTKEAAQKVVELVIEKMRKGEKLPTVTREELQRLNVE